VGNKSSCKYSQRSDAWKKFKSPYSFKLLKHTHSFSAVQRLHVQGMCTSNLKVETVSSARDSEQRSPWGEGHALPPSPALSPRSGSSSTPRGSPPRLRPSLPGMGLSAPRGSNDRDHPGVSGPRPGAEPAPGVSSGQRLPPAPDLVLGFSRPRPRPAHAGEWAGPEGLPPR
jgi:hypothetical protein